MQNKTLERVALELRLFGENWRGVTTQGSLVLPTGHQQRQARAVFGSGLIRTRLDNYSTLLSKYNMYVAALLSLIKLAT